MKESHFTTLITVIACSIMLAVLISVGEVGNYDKEVSSTYLVDGTDEWLYFEETLLLQTSFPPTTYTVEYEIETKHTKLIMQDGWPVYLLKSKHVIPIEW